ncbi:tumor necrosis factor alpha-induced protein 3-like isoform X2 [Glandiceps talaboti]
MVHAQYDENGPNFNINRKLAVANQDKARFVKERVKQDVAPGNQQQPFHFRRMASYSVLLPPLNLYPEELKAFLYKDFIDHMMFTTLFQASILNWCRSAKQVLPILTTADGNCLLHAIAMAIWGIEDDDLTLRRLLYQSLTENDEFLNNMKARWENERKKQDGIVYDGRLEYLSVQWNEEWTTMIRIAEARRRPAEEGGLLYECLDEFHVFVMANILRRPIIVAADKMWRSYDGISMQPQNFSGIYLPLCWPAEQCIKTPVLLSYNEMHFTPLVFQASGTIGNCQSMTANAEYAFPIVHKDLTPMTVHFLLDQEERQVMELLPQYLTVVELDHTNETGQCKIQAALARQKQLPIDLDLIPDFFMTIESQYHHYLDMEFGGPPDRGPQKCIMESCQTVGNWATNNGICDECLKHLQEQPSRQVSLLGSPISYATPAEQQPSIHQEGPPAHVRLPSYDEATGRKPEPTKGQQQYIPSILPIKCANETCQYFCSIATGDYCHECSNKLNAGVEIPKPQKVGRPIICVAPNCMNPGNSLTNNLCKVCYDQERFNTQGSARPLPATAPPPSIISMKQGGALRSSSEPLKLGGMPVKEQKRSSSVSSSPLHAPYQSSTFEDERRTNSLPNSLPSTLDGVQKCLVPDCRLTGYLKYQGMCGNCFEQQRRILNDMKGQQQIPVQKAKPIGDHSNAVMGEQKPKVTREAVECKNDGCDMFGTAQNGGYCSKCFLTVIGQASKKQTQQVLQTSSGTVPKREPNFREAQIFNKCKTENCNRVGFKTNDGYCNVCVGTHQNVAPQGPVGAAGTAAGTRDGKVQKTKFKVHKYLCVNPGCEGVRINNDAAGDMCYWCYNKAVKGIVQETAPLPEPADRVRHEEIPVAAPAAVPEHRNICINPKCDHQAISADVALCQRCLNVLEAATTHQPTPKAEEQKTTKPSESKQTQYTLPCATHDCDNFRKPGRQGFCNDCYYKYLDQEREQGEQVQRPVNPKVGESKLLKEERKTCQAPGCEMFGNPDQNNLCSKCFRRHLAEQYGGGNADNQRRPAPLSPYHGMAAAKPNKRPDNIYDEPWGANYGYRHIECATAECYNVANPNILDGLCGECYHVYQDIQLIPRYTLGRKIYHEPEVIPPPKAEKPRCKYDACDHFGNPKCFGYCHECYEVLMVNAPEQLQQLKI